MDGWVSELEGVDLDDAPEMEDCEGKTDEEKEALEEAHQTALSEWIEERYNELTSIEPECP
jgi:hypothetical protein